MLDSANGSGQTFGMQAQMACTGSIKQTVLLMQLHMQILLVAHCFTSEL